MTSINKIKNEFNFAQAILRNRPFQCLIQVTNRCNMRCKFCDFWPNFVERKQELSVDDYKRISQDLTQYGSFIISVEGGEPMVRTDLADIVNTFAEHHFPILFTNGWYVTETIARQLFASGLHQVGVSIDFPDAQRHDSFRGLEGAFDRACKAIEILKNNAPREGGQVHVISVLMKENQHDIESLLEFSKSAGVGHHFTLVSNSGYRRADGATLPSIAISQQLLSLRKRYPHLRSLSHYVEHMDKFLLQEELPVCNAGRQSFNIDHVGNVSPCIEKIDNSFGNVQQEPITDIIQRMSHLDEVKNCQNCWTLCRGLAQSFDGRGSLRNWNDLVSRRYAI